MKYLAHALILSAACITVPVHAQSIFSALQQDAEAQSGRGSRDPDYALLRGLAMETSLFTFIETTSAPLVEEARMALHKANPSKANEVEAYVRAERVRYNNHILTLAVATAADSGTKIENISALSQHSRTVEGQLLVALVNEKIGLCLMLPAQAKLESCAKVQQIATRLSGENKALLEILVTLRHNALTLVTMSDDPKDALAIFDHQTATEAGLLWTQ